MNNPIHTLENVVMTFLNQKDKVDLDQLKEYFNRRFAPDQEIESEDFKKAYMYIHQFVPNDTLGNQRLIYRTIQGRFALHLTQLRRIFELQLNTATIYEKKKINERIIMLDLLPNMIW